VTYEYGVVIRRQPKGKPATWQFWLGAGCLKEHSSFLAVMDWAGGLGFEAFAAGNFDQLGVPEVLMKRALAAPPPPQLPAPSGGAGEEFAGATARRPAAPRAKAKAAPRKRGA
jgi:hypothetical protein